MRRVDVPPAASEHGGEEGLAGCEVDRVGLEVVAFYAEEVGAGVEGWGGRGWEGEGRGEVRGGGEDEGEGRGMEEEEEDGEEGDWWVHLIAFE